MLNKIIKLSFILVLFISLGACNKKEQDNSTFWGKTEYYSDFLWKKYKPIEMTKKIHFDFNEDAAVLQNIKFGLLEKNEKGEFVNPKDITLYKNGDFCKNNIFTVSGQEKEAEITVIFNNSAKKGTHKWAVVLLDNAGLDRVNDLMVAEIEKPVTLEWLAKKNNVWNPLAFLLSIILSIILAALIIWIVFLKKAFYTTFKVGAINIREPAFSSHKLKGARKIVFSNKKKNQAFFNRLFTGKIIYVQNEIWSTPCVFIPKNKNSIKSQSQGYLIDPPTFALQKGQDYTLTDSSNGNIIKLIIF